MIRLPDYKQLFIKRFDPRFFKFEEKDDFYNNIQLGNDTQLYHIIGTYNNIMPRFLCKMYKNCDDGCPIFHFNLETCRDILRTFFDFRYMKENMIEVIIAHPYFREQYHEDYHNALNNIKWE